MDEKEKAELKIVWLKVIAVGAAALIFFLAAAPYLYAIPFLLPVLFLAAVFYTLAFIRRMLDKIAPPDTTPHPDLTHDDRRLD